MIRTRSTILGYLLLLLIAVGALPSFGLMRHIEGWANFRLILCHRDALLCDRSVSGEGLHELFAIDRRTGAELWRYRSSNDTWSATGDGGMVYHETGGTLFKRNLTNGVILWQTPLNSLAPRKPPFSFSRLWRESLARIRLGGDTAAMPTRYSYQAPLLTGGKLLLARTASKGGGCVVIRCFEDWFLLDPATGRMLRGGPGEFQGQLGSAAIFSIRDPNGNSETDFAIEKGERCNLRPLVTTGGERLDPAQLVNFYAPPSISHGSPPLRVDSAGGSSLLVFDQERGNVARLSSPAVRSRADGDWQLLSSNLLHFVTGKSWFSEDNESKLVPQIELFDLRGELLANLQVPPPSETCWGIDWVGPVGKACVAFARWQGDDAGNLRQITADDLLLVDVPALQVRRTIELGARPTVGGERSERSFHTAPDCPYVFILTGDVSLVTMSSNSIPHELKVEAIDPATGKVAWRHREKVTIRKVGG